MKKFLAFVIFLGLAGLLGWQVYLKLQQARAVAATPRGPRLASVAVELGPVTRGSIREVGVFTGSLTPASQFIIAPRIPGRMKRLLVNIGDPVRRNQAVVEIVDEEYRMAVEQAQAALKVVKASLEEAASNYVFAERDLERNKALGQKQIVSTAKLEETEAKYESALAKKKLAEAKVAEQEAALKAAEVRLSYTRIEASWRGGSEVRYVGEKYVDEGTLLAANAPIATVVEIDSVIGVIYVTEKDYPRIGLGQEAVIQADALPGQRFKGRVLRIAPVIKESSRQGRVEISIPNPGLVLRPGMFIRAELEFQRHAEATLIPLTALVIREGRSGVFLADTDKMRVKFAPVKPGIFSDEQVEVLEPPLSGQVVTLGHHLLEDGSAITLPGQRAAAGASGPRSRPGPGAQGRPGRPGEPSSAEPAGTRGGNPR